MFAPEADLFFMNPATPPDGRHAHGTLYLLRRDIRTCLGRHPETNMVVSQPALWPAATAVFTGIDLLGRFRLGGGRVGDRFRGYLGAYFDLCPGDCEVLYQLRNTLTHSFCLYSRDERRKIDYHFALTSQGRQLLVSAGDQHAVDLETLHQRFDNSVAAYQHDLDDSEELQRNFMKMFRLYGSSRIGPGGNA